jgi:hypothetical protein
MSACIAPFPQIVKYYVLHNTRLNANLNSAPTGPEDGERLTGQIEGTNRPTEQANWKPQHLAWSHLHQVTQ